MNKFRARLPNEDLGVYLRAKQAYELETTGKTGVELGVTPGATLGMIAEPTGTEKSTMDEILNWVKTQALPGTPGAFANREIMIDQGVQNWGEDFKQFIVDTIYRELRSPDEPPYEPPAYEVYKGEIPTEKEGEEMTWDDVQKLITDAITAAYAQKESIGEFEWTDADTERIFAEFEELYGPGYKALVAKEQVGAREAVEEITRTKELAVKREARNLEEAMTESRASMATRGLAFSGIREKEEAGIEKVSTEEMENIRALAQRGRTQTLRGLEAQIGTQATQALYPGYEMPTEYAGLGLTTPASIAYGFERQPITGIPGTITRQSWLDWEMEKRQRKAEEMETWRQQFIV